MTLPKSTREGRCQFHSWVPVAGEQERCIACQKVRRAKTSRDDAGMLPAVTSDRAVNGRRPEAAESGSSAPAPRRRTLKPGRGFSASKAQREKARTEPCVVTGQEALYGAIVDPAHLWPRAAGGCDDPLCTVPLVRHLHREFDEGNFDLLPYLVRRRVPELLHALEHADGDLCALLHRLTGERPYRRVAA